jgi:transposase-like protein
MSPRKLSDTDKSDILNLYRNPEETTSTLALRYGVSNSTISRILKSNLQETEYEELIQQKRLNRTASSVTLPTSESSEPPKQEVPSPSLASAQTPTQPVLKSETEESSISNTIDGRRRRRRSSVSSVTDEEEEKAVQTELPLEMPKIVQKKKFENTQELVDEIEPADSSDLEELLDEDDLIDLEDEDDDLDEDLDEDWEDDGFDDSSQEFIKTSFAGGGFSIQVLPLSEAPLPKTCYLVVDRAAELIARPLKEFSDLGQIPAEEIQERTLPIFDNHKVARRFSNRSQRVIKVPDSRMLQKARSHLQAKGITRLLIDGQVYSLFPTPPRG